MIWGVNREYLFLATVLYLYEEIHTTQSFKRKKAFEPVGIGVEVN